MPMLSYEGATFEVKPGESVLDALLRGNVRVAHSCRSGACQSCLMQTSASYIPALAQQGLKPALKEQGYFLSCQLRPETDVSLQSAKGLELAATINSLELLTATVLRVLLRTVEPFEYRAGQYLTLLRADGLARSYSIASLPATQELELHVRRVPNGQMSGWLFNEARPQDAVTIRGPAGDCFYTAGQPDQPLLLAGTGTGLAPLLGICKDAITQGHRGPIHLYHGALNSTGLYGETALSALRQSCSTFAYHPVVLHGEPSDILQYGPLDKVILSTHPRLTGWRGFICGDPAIVQLLKKKFFLAGMASRDIAADAFVESAVIQ